jgi:hypothetical protein
MLRHHHRDGTITSAVGRKPVAKLVVLYKTPKDKAAFNAYYKATHIPLAYKIPASRNMR